jgi:hypothetical protein
MGLLLNRAKVATTTTGTGTVTLGSAATAFQSWASAGAVGGQSYSYLIEDGTAWELGVGVYTASGTTLSRALIASSTGSLLNLSGAATVACVQQAADTVETLVEKYVFPGGTSTKTFSAIPQAGTDLLLRFHGRGTQSAIQSTVNLQFNGLSTSIYSLDRHYFTTGTNVVDEYLLQTAWANTAAIAAATAPANYAAYLNFELFDYAGTTFTKQGRFEGSQPRTTTTSSYHALTGVIMSTSKVAITSLTISLASGNFVAGSYAALYMRR